MERKPSTENQEIKSQELKEQELIDWMKNQEKSDALFEALISEDDEIFEKAFGELLK